MRPSYPFSVALSLAVPCFGCAGSEDPGQTGTDTEGSTGGSGTGGSSCDTAAAPGEEGVWDPPFQFPPAIPPEAQVLIGNGMMQPSVLDGGTTFLPIHVAHVVQQEQDGSYTGKILAFAYAGDQYLYDIETGSIEYHPLFEQASPPVVDPEDIASAGSFPNVFCAGHTQQADGTIFLAGGNVNGQFTGGGLDITAVFDPDAATAWTEGWELVPAAMNLDRWYPTLKELEDGRKIVLGGYNLLNTGLGEYDFVETFDPAVPSWTTSTPARFEPAGTSLLYPLLFVLPDGLVFYAGSEDARTSGQNLEDNYNGRVFDPDSGAWGTARVLSDPTDSWVQGGSAVQYEPGKILRSGGGNTPRPGSQIVDFNAVGTPVWEPTLGSPAQARHLHSMTLLPDGRVLVTGGNIFAINAGPPENSCVVDETLDDTLCAGPGAPACCSDSSCRYMELSCQTDADCPPQVGECDEGECREGGSCSVDADCTGDCITANGLNVCNARNSECGAVYEAEVWDPQTECWTTLAPMQVPRMYHSTAMLLPDGSILSMGGGNNGGTADQTTAEIFHPYYGDGPAPTILEINDPDDSDRIAYGETITILVPPGSPVPAQDVEKVTVVRLGSETHQNDMSQRFLCLGGCGEAGREITVSQGTLQVQAPASFGEAPAGYYMLFLISSSGVPSVARYVHIGEGTPSGAAPSSWRCQVSSTFSAAAATCEGEPEAGACDVSDVGSSSVATPSVPAQWAGGTAFDGWVAHLPAGLVADVGSPTLDELAIVESRCVDACEQQWQNRPEVAANCEAAGAFMTPTFISNTTHAAVLGIDASQRDGSGLFPAQSLVCELESTCCEEFDELTCSASPERSTPAGLPLGTNEEYVFELDTTDSRLEVAANGTVDDAMLYGNVGFSECAAGNASASCPFYLGSLSVKTIDQIKIPVTCPNGNVVHRTLYHLDLTLAQPAMGIAEGGTDRVGFPKGALVFDATFKMNNQDYAIRGSTQVDVSGVASPSNFVVEDVPVVGFMPACWGQDDLPAYGTFSLQMDISAGPQESPPSVAITMPSTVACPASVALTATVTDPDTDLDQQRWYVDGVLLSSSMSSLAVTQGHSIQLVATDQRGAATTATHSITCQ